MVGRKIITGTGADNTTYDINGVDVADAGVNGFTKTTDGMQ